MSRKTTNQLEELLSITKRKLSAVRRAVRDLHVAYDKKCRELKNANDEIDRLNDILSQK